MQSAVQVVHLGQSALQGPAGRGAGRQEFHDRCRAESGHARQPQQGAGQADGQLREARGLFGPGGFDG